MELDQYKTILSQSCVPNSKNTPIGKQTIKFKEELLEVFEQRNLRAPDANQNTHKVIDGFQQRLSFVCKRYELNMLLYANEVLLQESAPESRLTEYADRLYTNYSNFGAIHEKHFGVSGYMGLRRRNTPEEVEAFLYELLGYPVDIVVLGTQHNGMRGADIPVIVYQLQKKK